MSGEYHLHKLLGITGQGVPKSQPVAMRTDAEDDSENEGWSDTSVLLEERKIGLPKC